MKLTLADPSYLKDSISIISDLVNDAVFKVDKDKIELVAVDPANVAMVFFRLLSSAFTEYNVKKPVELAINLESLKQILRRSKPDDIITLELDEENNKLKIILAQESLRTFNLSLLHMDEQQQKIPSLKFPLKIEANSSNFDDAVEDVGIVADSVALIVEPKKFIVASDGTTTNAKVELHDKTTKIEMEKYDKIKSKYSVEYLKKMIKASKLSNEVVIQFGNDYPLKLDYLVKDKLSLEFVLAPRIQNE